ncbi:GNAT family N-acetyltransferase [Vibrio chagasii]|nr:GNAT family N-acetyltransferase [Vibrio chagasii]
MQKQLFDPHIRSRKSQGYEKLFAYVLADNERALAAYLKQGFETVGIAKNTLRLAASTMMRFLSRSSYKYGDTFETSSMREAW